MVAQEVPGDETAALRLREWLAGSGGLDAVVLDLSGADLSGADFTESWFTDAKLVDVKLAGADLYRSDAQGADLTGADLTGVRPGACGTGRCRSEERRSRRRRPGQGVALRRGRQGRELPRHGTLLEKTDICGADLRDAVFQENSFRVVLDEKSKLKGAKGTVFGPVVIVEGAVSRGTGPTVCTGRLSRSGRGKGAGCPAAFLLSAERTNRTT